VEQVVGCLFHVKQQNVRPTKKSSTWNIKSMANTLKLLKKQGKTPVLAIENRAQIEIIGDLHIKYLNKCLDYA